MHLRSSTYCSTSFYLLVMLLAQAEMCAPWSPIYGCHRATQRSHDRPRDGRTMSPARPKPDVTTRVTDAPHLQNAMCQLPPVGAVASAEHGRQCLQVTPRVTGAPPARNCWAGAGHPRDGCTSCLLAWWLCVGYETATACGQAPQIQQHGSDKSMLCATYTRDGSDRSMLPWCVARWL